MVTLADLHVGEYWKLVPQSDRNDCGSNPGEEGYIEILNIEDSGSLWYRTFTAEGINHGTCTWCYKPEDLLYRVDSQGNQLGKENMMVLKTLTPEQAFVLSDPEKSMIEAGVLTDQFQLTESGKSLFFKFLYEKNKTKFGEQIVDMVEETKAEIAKQKESK